MTGSAPRRGRGERARTLIQRTPVAGLVLAAQGAELLVVGRRRGASRLMRPASIRYGCIDQASCPVVVP